MTTTVVFIERPGAPPVEMGFDALGSLRPLVHRALVLRGPTRSALFDHVIYTDENPHPLAASGYPDEMVEGFRLVGCSTTS